MSTWPGSGIRTMAWVADLMGRSARICHDRSRRLGLLAIDWFVSVCLLLLLLLVLSQATSSPFDERGQQDISVSRLLELENLKDRNFLSLPYSPESFFSDSSLQP